MVLDASALIAHLDAEDAHHSSASAALEELAGERLGASPVTLAEVLVAPARTGRLQAASDALADLGVEEIPLGDASAPRLAALCARTGLKLPDCCVLLAARDAGARAVLTFDERLAAAVSDAGVAVP